DFKNKPALDFRTESTYVTQTSILEERLKNLKDLNGLEKRLEKLIETNDSFQTKLFELRMLSLNKFNYDVNRLRDLEKIKSEDKLVTLKDKQEQNIIYQKIVDDKMAVILKEIQEQKNTIKKEYDDNQLIIEAAFKNKKLNELENIKNASEVEVKKLKEILASIKLELKKTIEMRFDKKRMYKSQIFKLNKQIGYLETLNYKSLERTEKDLENELVILHRKILSYEAGKIKK
ncbi:14123_t:CDS:2, partial [Gigaspora margarita]